MRLHVVGVLVGFILLALPSGASANVFARGAVRADVFTSSANPPVLTNHMMRKRTRTEMWRWCKRKEIVIDAIPIRECDEWGIVKDSCFINSLYDYSHGHCMGWMRLYDHILDDDLHCEAEVVIWLAASPTSPTGWVLHSHRRKGTCTWEGSIG